MCGPVCKLFSREAFRASPQISVIKQSCWRGFPLPIPPLWEGEQCLKKTATSGNIPQPWKALWNRKGKNPLLCCCCGAGLSPAVSLPALKAHPASLAPSTPAGRQQMQRRQWDRATPELSSNPYSRRAQLSSQYAVGEEEGRTLALLARAN